MENIEIFIEEDITNISIEIEEVNSTVEILVENIEGKGIDDKHFTYNQSSPSSVWNIVHSLNKYPSVNIVNTSGNDVIGDVKYITQNNITITFSAPFSGKAYLN